MWCYYSKQTRNLSQKALREHVEKKRICFILIKIHQDTNSHDAKWLNISKAKAKLQNYHNHIEILTYLSQKSRDKVNNNRKKSIFLDLFIWGRESTCTWWGGWGGARILGPLDHDLSERLTDWATQTPLWITFRLGF